MIDQNFIISQYESGVKNYVLQTRNLGLWESENYVFQKYLKKKDRILDLGCGTGRTTFPLHKLGYSRITGVDLTPAMIHEAMKINKEFGLNIEFEIGDALNLPFDDSSFEVVIFSFNGLMSIPSKENRTEALNEIYRVLQANGLLLFTTHDRNKEAQYYAFWQDEKIKWEQGKQDKRLFEFGDILAGSKNETEVIYIHIPSEAEIRDWVESHGFEVLESFYRSDKFTESEMVKKYSGECRFWILSKRS